MELPCYQLLIDENVESDVEVNYVALVDRPAIEKNFLSFNQQALGFASINDEERIVVGPAMIPDMKIYRTDPDMGEHYVVFSRETVQQIAEKFYKKSFQNNANLMHDEALRLDDVTFFMSFIRNTEKGLVGMDGAYPEGTWFLGAKVNNEAAWNNIKSGKVKGFSVEGFFKYGKEKMSAADMSDHEFIEALKQILKD